MSELTDFIQGLKTSKINNIKIDDSTLSIMLVDGTLVDVCDEGQNCCEYRHMSTDDELEYFEGADLMDIKLSDSTEYASGYVVHDVQFLDVKTSLGVLTIQNHNEHNGYYGGFDVVVTVREPQPDRHKNTMFRNCWGSDEYTQTQNRYW